MMNDRFKFRAGIQFSYYNDDDKEKQIIIRIEPDGISSDGSVGICKPDLCEIIKKYDLSDREYDSLMEDIEGYEVAEDWILTYPKYIEQCTGLEDKNGKLIYENDVVKINCCGVPDGIIGTAIGQVYWNEEDAQYRVKISSEEEYNLYGIEINVIGNIHTEKLDA